MIFPLQYIVFQTINNNRSLPLNYIYRNMKMQPLCHIYTIDLYISLMYIIHTPTLSIFIYRITHSQLF